MSLHGSRGGESNLGDTTSDSEEEDMPWGHSCAADKGNRLRIFGINIGGFPNRADNPKNGKFRELVNTHQPDVVCMSEVNVAWQMVPVHERFGQRMMEDFGTTYSQSA